MNNIIQKKMKLFVLAIIILIILCILFINHYNKRLYVNITYDDSIKNVTISDIPNIKEEIIVDNTIKHTTTVNLNNIDIKIKINNVYKEDNLLTPTDIVDLEINNLNMNYDIYYSLKNDSTFTAYEIFNNNFLSNINTPEEFNLYIKIVVGNKSKVFNLGEYKLYDIIYEHDVNIEEDIEIGTIYNEDGTKYKNEDDTEYLYDNVNINQNIVIDNIETKEDVVVEEDNNDNQNLDNIKNEEDIGIEEDNNVKLNGNVYVIEETDLANIDITGHLFIDTEENITIDKELLVNSDVYSITVKNNNFTLNEQEYNYEYYEDLVKIKNNNNEEVNINDIFTQSKTELNDNNELVILKDETNSSFNLN